MDSNNQNNICAKVNQGFQYALHEGQTHIGT